MTTRRETLRPLIARAACAALACAVFALAACTVGGRLPSEPAGIIGTVTLVVPGDKFYCSMEQNDYTERAIQGMKAKLREKKNA